MNILNYYHLLKMVREKKTLEDYVSRFSDERKVDGFIKYLFLRLSKKYKKYNKKLSIPFVTSTLYFSGAREQKNEPIEMYVSYNEDIKLINPTVENFEYNLKLAKELFNKKWYTIIDERFEDDIINFVEETFIEAYEWTTKSNNINAVLNFDLRNKSSYSYEEKLERVINYLKSNDEIDEATYANFKEYMFHKSSVLHYKEKKTLIKMVKVLFAIVYHDVILEDKRSYYRNIDNLGNDIVRKIYKSIDEAYSYNNRFNRLFF